jgi:PAS domain S-box-containing protein
MVRKKTYKKSKIEIQDNPDKYYEIVSQIPGMIFNLVLHQDGSFSVPFVAGKVVEYSGYTPEEIVNNPSLFIEPIHSEDLPIMHEYLKQSAKTLKEYSVEHRLKTPDGETRWFHVKSIPEKLNNGDISWGGISVDITERKLLEHALKESEEQYQAVSKITSDYSYTFRVEPDGNIVNEWVTGALERITGFSKEGLIAKGGWESLIHPDDLHIPIRQLKLLFSNQSKTVEYRIIDKAGNIRWMKDVAKPVWDLKNNRLKKIYGAVQEITKQKNFEDALRESEERYKSLFLNNHSIMLLIDPENRYIVDANPAASNFYGWSRDDLIKKKISDINISSENKVSTAIVQAKQLKQNHFFFRHRLSNNETRDVEVYSNPIVINGKQLLYSIIHDITKRRKVEAKLRESEKHYREFFEENIAGAYISTPEGKLIDCNQEFLRIFGLDETMGAFNIPVSNYFINPKERVGFLNLLEKQKRITGYTPNLKKADGTPVHIIENASGEFDEDGNLRHIRGFLLDVTEQKKLEALLLQAQKMEAIGTLAGGIAHDFNNILSPILGHTEMLLHDIPDGNPHRESLTKIHSSTLRAKELVKHILAFSRQSTPELKLFKMQPIVNEVLNLIRSTIPKTIEIKQDIDMDGNVIKADPTQIHQIIMNLTTNAYHAMEKDGGELNVSLKEINLGKLDLINPAIEPGKYACLTVRDTGKGIPENIIQKIYDPFFTTKEKGKGTGMGLSVVHGIIKNLNGEIILKSSPGKGTEFKVYIPAEKAPSKKYEIKTDQSIPCGFEKILLVDDEEEVTIAMKKILERLGYQVVSETSSIEALRAFQANPEKFDMVITDMGMPNMAGDKFSVELIKIRPDIPILLCTGFSENMSEEKASLMGISGFLLKPISINLLSKKIREVFDCK